MKKLSAILLTLLLALGGYVSSRAQIPAPNQQQSCSISGTGQTCAVGNPAFGASSWSANIANTWVGAFIFECSLDQNAWSSCPGQAVGTSNAPVSTTSANGSWVGNLAAVPFFRVRATSWTSGTATVVVNTSAGVGPVSANAAGGTPAPLPSTANGIKVDIENLASPNPFPVTTPPPGPTPIPWTTASPEPVNLVLPTTVPVSLASIPPVNTPAPCTGATCTTTIQLSGATPTPFPVTTPAPAATDASGGIKTSQVGWNGLTVQAPKVLTSASAQSCTAVATTASLLFSIANTNTSAQTVTLTLFNDNAACTAGNGLYAIVLGAGQVVNFSGPGLNFSTAFSYTLSGAAANNIVLNYAK